VLQLLLLVELFPLEILWVSHVRPFIHMQAATHMEAATHILLHTRMLLHTFMLALTHMVSLVTSLLTMLLSQGAELEPAADPPP